MGRKLRFLGIALLVAAVWALLAGAGGFMAEEAASSLGRHAALGGLACLGAGLVGGLFGKMRPPPGRGRCRSCGAPTERGQIYCLDHLLKTVGAYRDQASAGRMEETPTRRPTRKLGS